MLPYPSTDKARLLQDCLILGELTDNERYMLRTIAHAFATNNECVVANTFHPDQVKSLFNKLRGILNVP